MEKFNFEFLNKLIEKSKNIKRTIVLALRRIRVFDENKSICEV